MFEVGDKVRLTKGGLRNLKEISDKIQVPWFAKQIFTAIDFRWISKRYGRKDYLLRAQNGKKAWWASFDLEKA